MYLRYMKERYQKMNKAAGGKEETNKVENTDGDIDISDEELKSMNIKIKRVEKKKG